MEKSSLNIVLNISLHREWKIIQFSNNMMVNTVNVDRIVILGQTNPV